LVSILIGVNDVWQEFNRNSGTSTGCYIRSLDYMLESLKNENEKITIVLNEPFALSVGQLKPIWEDFRPALKEKQDAVKNIAEKYNAVYIPLQEIFDKAIEQDNMEYWLWDGIHPTPQGHALIAHQWFKALA
jgi:lysophospholipase L1-like esterase